MTTLADRPNTALLVIDVQNGVFANVHDRDGVKVIAHTNLYWRYTSAPGRRAGTAATAEVSFAPAAAD
jgi:nicotinamidase-related amidase